MIASALVSARGAVVGAEVSSERVDELKGHIGDTAGSLGRLGVEFKLCVRTGE